MNLPSPLSHDSPIITQFKPVKGQLELNETNIELFDDNDQTILHNYCKYMNTTPLEVFRYLIEVKGCDINALNNLNNAPLHYGLSHFDPNDGGDITVLTYLLSQTGVDGKIQGRYRDTLLHTACDNINKLPIDIFKVLIERIGCDVNAQNKNNDTPIHYALKQFKQCTDGNIMVLIYLLTREDINGNIKGWNGNTVLHWACQKINTLPLDVFKVLIGTIGCDVDARDEYYMNTPLHFAFDHFLQDGDDMAVLIFLLTQCDVGADIKDGRGRTLLHIACQNINKFPLEIFKLLIETHSFDINVPLHLALHFFDQNAGGDIRVLRYLVSQSNVNTKYNNGSILLRAACQNINRLPIDVFKVLIKTHGTDIDVIHHALDQFNPNKGGDINILAYLINQKDVNVNTKYKRDYTVLHTTCIVNLENTWYSAKLNAEYDIILCQIIETFVNKCLELVLDETTS